MPRRKLIVFAVAAAGFSAVIAFAALLGLDAYCHHRDAAVAGLNTRGYRGPRLAR